MRDPDRHLGLGGDRRRRRAPPGSPFDPLRAARRHDRCGSPAGAPRRGQERPRAGSRPRAPCGRACRAGRDARRGRRDAGEDAGGAAEFRFARQTSGQPPSRVTPPGTARGGEADLARLLGEEGLEAGGRGEKDLEGVGHDDGIAGKCRAGERAVRRTRAHSARFPAKGWRRTQSGTRVSRCQVRRAIQLGRVDHFRTSEACHRARRSRCRGRFARDDQPVRQRRSVCLVIGPRSHRGGDCRSRLCAQHRGASPCHAADGVGGLHRP